MSEIHIYRDIPKPGETDAKWCAYRTVWGHVIEGTWTGNHESYEEALEAIEPRKEDEECV
jgi:hypothetical protein